MTPWYHWFSFKTTLHDVYKTTFQEIWNEFPCTFCVTVLHIWQKEVEEKQQVESRQPTKIPFLFSLSGPLCAAFCSSFSPRRGMWSWGSEGAAGGGLLLAWLQRRPRSLEGLATFQHFWNALSDLRSWWLSPISGDKSHKEKERGRTITLPGSIK